MSDEPEKKLFVDEDWKAQVEAEREAAEARKAQSDSASESKSETEAKDEPLESAADSPSSENAPEEEELGVHPLPPASFSMFISTLASEAMVSLGQMANPATGKAHVNLELAKYFIDTLGILQDKTQGNLTPDEQNGLEAMLSQLRLAFVEIKKQQPNKE